MNAAYGSSTTICPSVPEYGRQNKVGNHQMQLEFIKQQSAKNTLENKENILYCFPDGPINVTLLKGKWKWSLPYNSRKAQTSPCPRCRTEWSNNNNELQVSWIIRTFLPTCTQWSSHRTYCPLPAFEKHYLSKLYDQIGLVSTKSYSTLTIFMEPVFANNGVEFLDRGPLIVGHNVHLANSIF